MKISPLVINNIKYLTFDNKRTTKYKKSYNIRNNYNVSFSGSGRAFYAIREDGSYQRFTDRKTAENELSLAKTNIAECIQGKRNNTHGFGFIYADEIETADKNGQNM